MDFKIRIYCCKILRTIHKVFQVRSSHGKLPSRKKGEGFNETPLLTSFLGGLIKYIILGCLGCSPKQKLEAGQAWKAPQEAGLLQPAPSSPPQRARVGATCTCSCDVQTRAGRRRRVLAAGHDVRHRAVLRLLALAKSGKAVLLQGLHLQLGGLGVTVVGQLLGGGGHVGGLFPALARSVPVGGELEAGRVLGLDLVVLVLARVQHGEVGRVVRHRARCGDRRGAVGERPGVELVDIYCF